MEKDRVELLEKNEEVISLSPTVNEFDETEFIADISSKPKNSAWKEKDTGQEEKETTLFDGEHGKVTVDWASKASTPPSAKKGKQLPPLLKLASPRDEVQQFGPDDVKSMDKKQHLEEPKSSRRQSVGDWSIDSGRSMTSQSDSRSYRERLRDRFQSVKDRPGGGTSVTSSQSSFWHRRLKQKSPVVSKYDDFFRKEEEEISAALEKHQEMRVKWQQMDHLSSEAEESYNFFTKVWEEETDEVKEEKQKMSPPSGDEVETEDQTKLLASDFLGLPHESSSVVDPYVMPQVEDASLQLQMEEEMFFYPTNDPVPLEDKIDGETPIRRLEEEGIFVGDPPPIPISWQNRLEQRLLVAGDKHWFGNDGRLKTLSDPLLSTAFHPPLYNAKLNPALKLKYKPAAIFDMAEKRNSLEKVPDERPCLLELEVGTLTFHHHPLFTREFVLAQNIISMFDAYRDRLDAEVGVCLAQRLMALRLARDNLIRASVSGTPTHQAGHAEKLKKYGSEIRKLRDERLAEGAKDRELTARILQTWHNLKQLRDKQGFTSTKVCLQIFTPQNGGSPFSLPNELHSEIRNQTAELEAESWEDYNQKMEEYKQKWNEWKRELKTKKNSDEEPIPPLKPDLHDLKSEVSKLVSESIRPPEEPPIVLQLTEETPTMDISDTTEKQRRMLVKRCQIAFRILYNGQEVCQTLPQPLDQTFKVNINQLFAIRILHWPQTFSIELIMDGKRHLAEIFIPIPPCGVTQDVAEVEQLVFSSDRVVRPLGVGAVGAGVAFSIVPGGPSICPYTSGVVTCKVAWGQEDGQVLSPPEKYLPATVNNRNKVAPALNLIKDINKLKEWADKMQLDPNDPSNADFFESLKAASYEVREMKEPLLNPLVAEFEFCTIEEIENNPRLKLLRLRDQATPEFRGVRCIPLREREIPPDIFKIYEKRLTTARTPLKAHVGEGVDGEGVRVGGSSNSIEAHRAYGVVFLAKVKDNLVRRFRQARHQRALRDIVIEDQVPDMGTLGLTFMKWLQPKRPLRPRRKERTKVPVKSLAGHEVKIIVNVVRAFEVPVRADVDTISGERVGAGENGGRGGGGGSGGGGGLAAIVPVRPFVEISFQGQRCRTTTAEGANPTWNQDLHIPLKAPNGDMTPGGLQSISDNLYCHLYDETVVDLLEDDRQRTTNVHQRMERHWLGSLAIPFASLYANSRVEGTFKLYSPPVLLGYERDMAHHHHNHNHHHRHVGSASAAAASSPSSSHLRNHTFLTLFITVHPPLHLPEPFKERLECSEPPHLEQYMEEWEAQVKREFPHRSVKSTVMDVNGKSVCVTRFFRPLEPPVLEEGVVTTPEMAAWFVSKIPSTPGSILFPGLFDIWLTADQVLKVLQGDSDDLAILLCCFFLRLELRAWLVLGVGIPHGRSSFVLTQQNDQQWHVWDPTTGQKFTLNDSFCPLHRIHCLINDENVWMNVQKEELLRRVRLDVTRRGDWWGMFARGAAAAAATASLQPTQLELTPTSTTDAQVLQDRIEKLLRDSIAKWRPTARTVWNRYCIVTLRKLLPSLEKASWSNELTSSILQDHLQELSHILSSHKMCGFPLNFAYTKIEDIEEAVKGTGVHCYESLDVEFALAVYVHPYPCDILSVWVYVASLVRRR